MVMRDDIKGKAMYRASMCMIRAGLQLICIWHDDRRFAKLEALNSSMSWFLGENENAKRLYEE